MATAGVQLQRKEAWMVKIPVADSCGQTTGFWFDTDTNSAANSDCWPGAPHPHYDEWLYLVVPDSWVLVQRAKRSGALNEVKPRPIDWESRAILLSLEDAERWFERSKYAPPHDLIDAARIVGERIRAGVPPLPPGEARSRKRIAALLASSAIAPEIPPAIGDAIVTLLVAGIFLVESPDGLEIRHRAGALSGYDAMDAAMVRRLLRKASQEDPVFALLAPLFRSQDGDPVAPVSPDSLRAFKSRAMELRLENERRVPCANQEAAAAVIGFVEAWLTAMERKRARGRKGDVDAPERAWMKAGRLFERAYTATERNMTAKEAYDWLRDSDEFGDDMNAGRREWSLETFARHVRQWRRDQEGDRLRPGIGDVRSAAPRGG